MSAALTLPRAGAWLDALKRVFVPQAEPAAAPRIEPTLPRAAPRAGMRINPEAVARARAQGGIVKDQAPTAYALPPPPPGVLPKQAPDMAMDDALTDTYSFAIANTRGEGLAFMGYPYLAELAQRPEYRRISEIVASEMVRKWIKLTSVGDEDKTDKLTELSAELDRFRVRDIFRRAAEVDGFFGRAQIYCDTGDGGNAAELKTPLVASKAKIRRGGLRRIAVIEPFWTYPGQYNSSDPLRRDFYRPQSWYVMGKELHHTRLLTLIGREMPDMLKPAYSFGGLSLSQMAKPYVDNWIRTRQSVSDLLHSFSVSGIKTDLDSTLNLGSGQDMTDRATLFNLTRDNSGVMMLNKETEDWFNVSTPLGTLDKLQAQAQEQMSSVSCTPLVKLLGITPSGLNASSDSEVGVWEDWVHSQQEALFAVPLNTVIDLVQLSLWGEIDPDIRWHFVPLHQLNENELATLRKSNADAASVYIAAGVLSAEDERTRLAGEEDGLYAGLDPADLPDPPEEMKPGKLDDGTGKPDEDEPDPEPAALAA